MRLLAVLAVALVVAGCDRSSTAAPGTTVATPVKAPAYPCRPDDLWFNATFAQGSQQQYWVTVRVGDTTDDGCSLSGSYHISGYAGSRKLFELPAVVGPFSPDLAREVGGSTAIIQVHTQQVQDFDRGCLTYDSLEVRGPGQASATRLPIPAEGPTATAGSIWCATSGATITRVDYPYG